VSDRYRRYSRGRRTVEPWWREALWWPWRTAGSPSRTPTARSPYPYRTGNKQHIVKHFFIRWTFSFVYFVGMTIHELTIPTKR